MMLDLPEFTCCPRCSRDWNCIVPNHYECYKCPLVYSLVTQSPYIELLILDGSIYWWLDDLTCGFYSSAPNYDMPPVMIPWAPFSIVEEQLKTYIAFS